ncbi:MAG: YicC family protein [Planctomycetota bacterium]|nr:MAG: YicC family protein [Planctomycetota bacterium]
MIRSMTGFGTASADAQGCRFSVEVKSVNNRFFKATIRVPEELSTLETELESAIVKRLNRGSVMLVVRFVPGGNVAAAEVNPDAARSALTALLAALPLELRERATVDLGSLLLVPGVLRTDGVEQIVELARPVLLKLVDDACTRVLDMRAREGASIARELGRFGEVIRVALLAVSARAPYATNAYQDRLRARMNSLLAEVGATAAETDLLREVAVFAERSDIAEEVVRLTGHLAQFARVITASDAEPAGRTLDFLSQEMLREANTIASKSQDIEIAHRVVEMKTAIDRIKEQAANAE